MDAKADKEAKKMKESGGGGTRGKHRDGGSAKKNDGGASILKAASKIDFTNTEDANEWDAKYKQKLTKKPGNQILHTLAKMEGDTEKWSSQKVKEFLDWVLGRYHNLLKERDSEYGSQDGPMPIHTALLRGNACFVKAVLSNKDLINLNDVLPQYFSSRNTLHIAITSENRSMELIELLIEKCAELKLDKMFTAPGGGGGQDATTKNTPLHDCMAMDRTEEGLEEDDESSSSLSSDEEDDEGNESDDGDKGSVRSPEQDRTTKDHDWENVKSPLTARSPNSSKHPFGGNRRVNTIMIPGTAKERNDMLRVVKLLVDKHYLALMATNDSDKESRTPYQERLYQLRMMHSDKDEEGIQREIAKDEVANYIREYCIRNLPRDEIMKCLYHRGQGETEFHA
ncbi:hypothetical protein B0T14DRAFT_565173 [Immersiella caudata]|uniref:Uncharacterized protein n=1 Tax=Immersiella caudata TaxID=314043 RepID=A0AA40C3C9_9PEZI|nr:hypothetical protein B0T14DRAFT_565173 [Immersiella caudata]